MFTYISNKDKNFDNYLKNENKTYSDTQKL